MRITIELPLWDLAEVTLTPSLWAWLWRGDRTVTRFAQRTTHGRWIWDDTLQPIREREVENALDVELRKAIAAAADQAGSVATSSRRTHPRDMRTTTQGTEDPT